MREEIFLDNDGKVFFIDFYRALYKAFILVVPEGKHDARREESPSEIIRNMAAIGIDLQQWVKKGFLQFQTVRAFHFGLEMHLPRTTKFVSEFAPKVVIVDPVSGLDTSGTALEVESVLMRLVDFEEDHRDAHRFEEGRAA